MNPAQNHLAHRHIAGGCAICASISAGGAPRYTATAASSRRASMTAARPAVPAANRSSRDANDMSVPSGEYVIEAGWVLAHRDGKQVLIRDASVLVKDDRIAVVSEGHIMGNMPRIRVPGQILLPGFISGHTHTCTGSATRGIIESGRSYARPCELIEELSDDDLDDLTAFNLAELVRSGCTTQLEMSLSLRQAESYVRVAERWGVRGFPGPMVPGIKRLFHIWHRNENDDILHASVADTLVEIAAAYDFAKRHMGKGAGRIMPMMTPHATDTHTPETLKAILAHATDLGTGVHIHLSQRDTETAAARRLWGMTPTQLLQSLGYFDVPLFCAHMGGMDLSIDPQIMAASNAVMSHCPSGGGAGFTSQPYPEALAAGMKVNIGIDTHSNDYLENLKLAVVYGKVRTRLLSPTSAVPLRNPTAEEAVHGATLTAANGLGRSDLGRIEEGAKADLITIDVSGFLVGAGALPPEPLNNLLYANGQMVKHVITDGQIQFFDGHMVVDDEAQVMQRGGAVAQAIWDQLADEGFFAPADVNSREAREHLPPAR
jgi:5-methylthioadenosine/S-adenosylhomocysteine deaminase